MLVRTETPDACDTCGDERARRTISSTISCMKRGVSTRMPELEMEVSRASHAFCWAISSPSLTDSG
jgi:hypothetical protein